NGGQKATAQEALELLIELTGCEPRFLRRQLVEVIGSLLPIAKAESLDEGIWRLNLLFGILMKMLDIVDEAAWHTAENEDEDAGA
ncbi:importin-5-like protein, partial [Tanacetum coccineum]